MVYHCFTCLNPTVSICTTLRKICTPYLTTYKQKHHDKHCGSGGISSIKMQDSLFYHPPGPKEPQNLFLRKKISEGSRSKLLIVVQLTTGLFVGLSPFPVIITTGSTTFLVEDRKLTFICPFLLGRGLGPQVIQRVYLRYKQILPYNTTQWKFATTNFTVLFGPGMVRLPAT